MKEKEVKQMASKSQNDRKNGLGRGLGRDLGRRKDVDPGIAPGNFSCIDFFYAYILTYKVK